MSSRLSRIPVDPSGGKLRSTLKPVTPSGYHSTNARFYADFIKSDVVYPLNQSNIVVMNAGTIWASYLVLYSRPVLLASIVLGLLRQRASGITCQE